MSVIKIGDYLPDDSGTLCKEIKANYPSAEIKCVKVERPLFDVIDSSQQDMDFWISRKYLDGVIYQYSFGDRKFQSVPGDFFRLKLNTNYPSVKYKEMTILLDPTNRYTTSLVIYQR